MILSCSCAKLDACWSVTSEEETKVLTVSNKHKNLSMPFTMCFIIQCLYIKLSLPSSILCLRSPVNSTILYLKKKDDVQSFNFKVDF